MKTIKLILITILLLSGINIYAQTASTNDTKTWFFRPYWASNWGATTSFGVPDETREITMCAPQYNYVLGCDVTKKFTDKWGLTTGLRFERKGGHSQVVMKNFYTTTTLEGTDTPTQGYFSGSVKSTTDVTYLTLPVVALYNLNEKIDVRGGMYFSYALNKLYSSKSYDGKIRTSPLVPAIGVTESYSDFSDGISNFDMGLQVGIVYKLWKRLDVNMDINWGLVNAFDAPESGMTQKVYNIYFCCGIGWSF